MSETPGADRDSGGYMRLPLPVVAIGLFALLAVLLGVGLYANANLRSPGVSIPTSVPVAAVATAPPAAVTPLGSATTQLATPVPAMTPDTPVPPISTAMPATTGVKPDAASTPTISAIAPLTIQTESSTPAASEGAATATPTVSPELAAEVGEAYEAYWRVRARALYDLDVSHLPDVMSGDHLEAVQERISELGSEGRAIETVIDHNYVVIQARGDDAKVADSYIDDSVYVGLADHAPLGSPSHQRLNEIYVMYRNDGTWRVVDLVRSP